MTLKFDLPEGFLQYDGSGIPVRPSTPVWVIPRGEPEFSPGGSAPAALFLWKWDGEGQALGDLVAYAVAPQCGLEWGKE